MSEREASGQRREAQVRSEIGVTASVQGGNSGSWVAEVADCRMVLGEASWPFADENKEAIAAFWQNAVHRNPKFFDGIVLLTAGYQIEQDILAIELFATRFRNFLYWRHNGFADAAAVDAFGSGIIRAADGGVLLVRQRPGNINEGLFYFPGGFIDRRDVDATARIDIAASITRELHEELGLKAGELVREAGYVVSRAGPQLSIAAVFECPLRGRDLVSRIDAFLARETDPEIAEAIVVRRSGDLDGLRLAPYARGLIGKLLA